MIFRVRYILVGLALIALFGCATTPTALSDAQPGHLIYAKSAEGIPAIAVFVRDSGIVGAALTTHIYIDGQHAAELEVTQKVEIGLTAGEYVFGVETSPYSGSATFAIDQRLEAGRTYYYRIGGDMNGMRIQRSVVANK